MKAVFLSPLCLVLSMGVLPAQIDRPIDELEDLPPAQKPIGAIDLGKRIERFENLLGRDLNPEADPSSMIDWKQAEKLLREAYQNGWELRFRGEPERNPLLRELFPQEIEKPVVTGGQWRIGVQLAPARSGDRGGLRITGLAKGSPAENAGLKAGDVVTKLNNLKLRDFEMIADLIQIIQGQEIELTVRRGGKQLVFRLTPQKRDAKPRGDLEPIPTKPLVPVDPAPKPAKPKVAPKVFSPPPTPEQRRLDQLHRDNREIQGLLRELIREVKKLGD